MMQVCCHCSCGESLLPVYRQSHDPAILCLYDDSLCVVFAECTLDAQPLNLNSAFHEESLSQVLAGELLPYFNTIFFMFFSAVLCEAISRTHKPTRVIHSDPAILKTSKMTLCCSRYHANIHDQHDVCSRCNLGRSSNHNLLLRDGDWTQHRLSDGWAYTFSRTGGATRSSGKTQTPEEKGLLGFCHFILPSKNIHILSHCGGGASYNF